MFQRPTMTPLQGPQHSAFVDHGVNGPDTTIFWGCVMLGLVVLVGWEVRCNSYDVSVAELGWPGRGQTCP